MVIRTFKPVSCYDAITSVSDIHASTFKDIDIAQIEEEDVVPEMENEAEVELEPPSLPNPKLF